MIYELNTLLKIVVYCNFCCTLGLIQVDLFRLATFQCFFFKVDGLTVDHTTSTVEKNLKIIRNICTRKYRSRLAIPFLGSFNDNDENLLIPMRNINQVGMITRRKSGLSHVLLTMSLPTLIHLLSQYRFKTFRRPLRAAALSV